MDDKPASIYINGKEILCKYHKMDICNLKFHPENPRIASILAKHVGKIDEELIDSTLWKRNQTKALKRNIEEHGGLQHPIIVYQNKVIEGNTRFCCYRHLYNEFKTNNWKFIECKILIGDISEKDINTLLGTEHIVGKIEWDTYEKGYWMTTMLERDHYSYEELEKIVRQCRSWIDSHVNAYKTMVKEKVEDQSKFSHFVQLASNAEIKKIKKDIDPQIEDKIIKAIKRGQFSDAKDIRKIPTICKDKNAKKRLFEKGEECGQVFYDLKSTKPTIDSTFIRSIEDVTERIQKMKRSEIGEFIKTGQDKAKLKKLAKEVILLCRELEIEIPIHNKK